MMKNCLHQPGQFGLEFYILLKVHTRLYLSVRISNAFTCNLFSQVRPDSELTKRIALGTFSSCKLSF